MISKEVMPSPQQFTEREILWKNFHGHEIPSSVRFSLKFLETVRPGELVLDDGCGYGSMSKYLAQEFGAKVVGIDINESGIEYARENKTDPNVLGYEIMDASHLEYPDNKFDKVIAAGLISGVELEIRKAIFKEAYRVLKPGGVFAVAEFALDIVKPGNMEKYLRDAQEPPKEWGQKIIRVGSKKLVIVKHFTGYELENLFEEAGFTQIKVDKYPVKSGGIVDKEEVERDQLTVWGVKPKRRIPAKNIIYSPATCLK